MTSVLPRAKSKRGRYLPAEKFFEGYPRRGGAFHGENIYPGVLQVKEGDEKFPGMKVEVVVHTNIFSLPSRTSEQMSGLHGVHDQELKTTALARGDEHG